MTNHSQLNLIMLATVIGLAIFLYLRPGVEKDQEYKVSILATEAVESIQLIRNEKEIILKQLNSVWHLEKPFLARADERKVIELLEVLSASSNVIFPKTEQAHLGLDQPIVELYINDSYFGFGGLAPTTNLQYLVTDNSIYLVFPRYSILLPVNPLELVSTNLLAINEIPVRFEINNLIVQRQGDVWNIISPDNNNENLLSQDELKQWTQSWHTVDATTVTFHPLIDSNEDMDSKFRISLLDGQEIFFKVQKNASEVIFLRIDESLSFHFPVDVGKRLLAPTGIEADKTLSVN
ncbi:MAG: DUF4340 domain-containing protein [Betaproteobacteria bacterium]|nr:DUF4340 domain-containing protein [Betaproteobacteria bacterium]